MTVSDRSYLSIGEVLTLLQGEFPDVTISKIRFLESQGLIDPERTPSGYRKFYAADIDRLRFILHEQRAHYLPLKVIRDRLGDDAAPAVRDAAADVDPVTPSADVHHTPTAPSVATTAPAAVAATAPAGPAPAARATAAAAPAAGPGGTERVPVWMQRPAARTSETPAGSATEPVSLSFDELAKASGLAHAHLRDLESFGLVTGRAVGMVVSYGSEALRVARLAAAFEAHGLEPRHLRMFRTAAEREASLYEQVVLPLVKQRNPQARAQAAAMLSEMSALGGELRRAMLHEALLPYTDL